ncbi:MAG: DUF4430 domain-containing protein [Candidatus Bathyarchaeia archaeon]
MSGRSSWMWVSLGLLCLLIVAAYLAVHYYNESAYFKGLYGEALEELKALKEMISVNILIDYGNGTQVWYNNTSVMRGASVLTATQTIANVEYTDFGWGIFVDSINGIKNEGSWFWMWYIWEGKWVLGPVASDRYVLREGDTIMWRYEVPSF